MCARTGFNVFGAVRVHGITVTLAIDEVDGIFRLWVPIFLFIGSPRSTTSNEPDAHKCHSTASDEFASIVARSFFEIPVKHRRA